MNAAKYLCLSDASRYSACKSQVHLASLTDLDHMNQTTMGFSTLEGRLDGRTVAVLLGYARNVHDLFCKEDMASYRNHTPILFDSTLPPYIKLYQ